jgi:biofilm PGA synthesis lipoprotein PgaB
LGNPQGNLLPAAIVRTYTAQKNSYEGDAEYLTRVRSDLAGNSNFIKKITGKRPRVMVWPYGRYNLATVNIAQSLDMPIMLTLDEGANALAAPDWNVKRVLIAFNTTVADLSEELSPPSSPRLERVMHVDLDYVYDPDPARQEANLGKLLDRVKAMKVSTVYLQAYADPDGNGAADSVYFPNRVLPMRADLFNRAAWQLRTRAGAKVFAWMPLLAFELPADHPLAKHRVTSAAKGKANEGYPRLTPFDPQVRRLISGIYEDLAKHAIFEGILFHDDAVLTDYEDASQWALDHYSREWGLPGSISGIRSNPEFMAKWTEHKTRFLTGFSLELARIIRQYQPQAKTARNIYAEVVLNPHAEEWFAQSLPDFLQSYDYTAVMAMPFMENAQQPMPWLAALVQAIARQPQGLQKAVFELQAMDWRNSTPVDSHVLAEQMRLLQKQGARNFGYYPDDFLNGSPDLDVIKPVFSLQDFPFTGNTR